MCSVIKGEGLMTGPYRRWCISGRRLAVWEMPYFTIEFISIAIRKTTKVDSIKKASSSDPITAYKMFALETPRRGFCQSAARRMLSHGQFRISLRLCLDCIPGVCSVSGIQAGKSVHSGRRATGRCPHSARTLGRSAQPNTVSRAPGSEQRQQVPLNLSVTMQIETAERAVRKFWFDTCLL